MFEERYNYHYKHNQKSEAIMDCTVTHFLPLVETFFLVTLLALVAFLATFFGAAFLAAFLTVFFGAAFLVALVAID